MPRFICGSQRFQLVVMLMLCNVCLYINRGNMSVLVLTMYSQERSRALVLAGFYAGYPCLQIIAGQFAAARGGKNVLLGAVLVWSVATLLVIPAYTLGPWAVCAARVLLGVAEGANYPAQTALIAAWVPSHERSRAWALLAAGEGLGNILALCGCAFFAHFAGWRAVILVSALLGIVWALIFASMTARSPETSVRITSSELNYIQHSREYAHFETSLSCDGVPWRRFFVNQALWGIMIPHFCFNWGYILSMSILPDFYESAFNMSYDEMGILTILPYALLVLVNMLGALFADLILLQRLAFSLRAVRKIMTFAGLSCASAFFFALSCLRDCGAAQPSSSNVCPAALWAAILVALSVGLSGLTFSGFQVNFIDISPRFSPQLFAISNTFAAGMPGVFGNLSVAWFNKDFSLIFAFAAGLQLFGALWYLAVARAEDQQYQSSSGSLVCGNE